MKFPTNCDSSTYFYEPIIISAIGFSVVYTVFFGTTILFRANKKVRDIKYVFSDRIDLIFKKLVKLTEKIDTLILSMDKEGSFSPYESSIEDTGETTYEGELSSKCDEVDRPNTCNVESKLEELGSVMEKDVLTVGDFKESTSSQPILSNVNEHDSKKVQREEIPEPLSLPLPGCNPYTMFPVVHDDIWKTYKSFQSSRWLSEEIILDKDMDHWIQLSDNERYFIKMVLGFFAASDGIVSANLAERFMSDTAWATVKAVYTEQMSIEQIHSETYSILIDKYVTDPIEKNMLFNAIEHLPAVQGKANWALKWVKDQSSSFAQRMIAFAIVEGIFFAGSFCAIFWLREKGIMPGLTLANSFIARDESSHTDFACLLYSKYIVNKLTFEEVKAMMVEAVDIEDKFINDSLPCKLLGMNNEAMSQYIRFMADRITVQLGYKPIFEVKNPFPFMARAGTHEIVNFFENRSSAYSLAVTSVADLNTQSINTESNDF